MLVGALVFVALFAMFVLRVCLGAGSATRALDDGFAALATALSSPQASPERSTAFNAATERFSDASGSAIGSSLPILALEMTVRLRDGPDERLEEPLPAIFEALRASDPKRARTILASWRDQAPPATNRDTHALLHEFLQRLVEKMGR